jgi:hypothetical protein
MPRLVSAKTLVRSIHGPQQKSTNAPSNTLNARDDHPRGDFTHYRNEVVMKLVRITIVIVVIALIMAFAAVAVGYLK